MNSALNGIKILDLSRFAPGPYCSMILGDLGADVIMIEQAPRPGKKPTGVAAKVPNTDAHPREFPSPGSPHDALNRNKRSIAIDLKADAGRQIFYRMVEKADVVLEGFRPGVARRLGIDYDRLKTINRGIIYCAITGYGQDGPYKNLVGHDINYISQSGVLGLLGKTAIPGNYIGDMAGGGLQAAIGILAAVIARQTSGEGQFVDISMTDGAVSQSVLYMGGYFQNGHLADEADRVSMGVAPFYTAYETKDGKKITLACSEPWFFKNLCTALDCEQFIDYQFDKSKAAEVKDHLTRIFKDKTRDEWFELLSQKDIAISKVLDPEEVPEDPQINHRNMVVELDHPREGKVKQVGIAIKLSGTPGCIRKFSPTMGEDTRDILSELGYDAEAIDRLADDGVVFLEK
jgi:crotonobetainyl-CoA:carnitine CoA-transferase CaiB-like acyl-CoA transferase